MKKIAFITSLGLLLFACSNSQKPTENAQKSTTEITPLEQFKTDIAKIEKNGDNNIYSISSYLQLSGAEFMDSLVNNPHNVEKYMSSNYLAAANLGIYNADVIYQAGYGKTEGAMLSYNAANELAHFIGLGEVYGNMLFKRMEEGVTADDSIAIKMAQALDNSKKELTKEEKTRLFVAMMLGINIEHLYILNNVIFNYNIDVPDDAKLLLLRKTLIVTKKQIEELKALSDLMDNYAPATNTGKEVTSLMKETIDIYMSVQLKNIEKLTPDEVFKNEKLLSGFEKIKQLRALLTE